MCVCAKGDTEQKNTQSLETNPACCAPGHTRSRCTINLAKLLAGAHPPNHTHWRSPRLDRKSSRSSSLNPYRFVLFLRNFISFLLHPSADATPVFGRGQQSLEKKCSCRGSRLLEQDGVVSVASRNWQPADARQQRVVMF